VDVGVGPVVGVEVDGVLASLPTHLTYECRRTASGTSLRNTVEIRPRGVLRLLGAVATSRVERAVADNLAVLKDRLEADNLGS
jgi:hypothetical protein